MHRPEFVRLTPAKLGDSGDDIAWAQRKLTVFPADGVLRESTVTRIRGFQYAHQIPATGELDASTYELLTGSP